MTKLIIPDGSGHTTITWEAADTAYLHEVIATKLKQGHTFHIIERRSVETGDLLRKLTRVEDLGDRRYVLTDHPDLRRLFENDKIALYRSEDDADICIIRRAHTADEVIENESMMLPPARGG